MNKNIIENEDCIAFHPGAYLEEIIEDLGITSVSFAQQVGVSAKLMDDIISGTANVTEDVAIKLAKQTGVSKQSWLNIQNDYNYKLQQINHHARHLE